MKLIMSWLSIIRKISILIHQILYEDQNVTVRGKMSDRGIIAQLEENNQVENGLSGEEDKEI